MDRSVAGGLQRDRGVAERCVKRKKCRGASELFGSRDFMVDLFLC